MLAPKAETQWDCFIAYASVDPKLRAKELFLELNKVCQPFLDAECIPTGEQLQSYIGDRAKGSPRDHSIDFALDQRRTLRQRGGFRRSSSPLRPLVALI